MTTFADGRHRQGQGVTALLAAPSATRVAVSSCDKERAQAFVVEYCLQDASDGCSSCVGMTHDEVLASKSIDTVYVPLPSKLWNYVIVKALQSGKHVYSGKPRGWTVNELK